jgi:hypothetical protein
VVSDAGLSNPKPAPEISGVTRTQTQSTRVSPVDSGVGAGGPHGFGFDCHPYSLTPSGRNRLLVVTVKNNN